MTIRGLLLSLLLVGSLVGPAWAQEAWCLANPANCICSERLNSAGAYVNGSQNYLWRLNDGGTKPCAFQLGDTGFIQMNPPVQFVNSTDATVLAALPAGHSVTHFFKTNDGYSGILDLAHKFHVTDPYGRRAMRFYLFVSSNMIWSSENGALCPNSGKIANYHMDAAPYFSPSGSFWAWTNAGPPYWTNWPGDCCAFPPGRDAGAQAALNPTVIKGKWFRIEMVMVNENLVGTQMLSYWKNVTNNGPVFKVLDSSVATSMGGASTDWTAFAVANITKNDVGDGIGSWGIELFRVANAGCTGFFAVSHIQYAAWTTNAGQLIGAATEIEGGGSPPAAPTNLRFEARLSVRLTRNGLVAIR